MEAKYQQKSPQGLNPFFNAYTACALTAFLIFHSGYLFADTTSVAPPPASEMASASIDNVKAAADKGDKEAQFQLGLKFLNGQDGLEANPAKACNWFVKAAEQDHVLAQYNSGVCYRDAVGFSKDSKRAFEWFFKAANQGNIESAYNIGLAYHFGEGTNIDLTQAMTWYQKAIEKNHIPAMYGLGLIYTNGSTEIPVDHPKALALYQQAAQTGYAPAEYMLGVYNEKGLAGLEKNQKLAFDWYSKAAAQKFKRAYLAIAALYKAQKDWPAYFSWIQTSASAGVPEGEYELAIAFRDGVGTPVNFKESVKWFTEAAKLEWPEAQYELGKIYMNTTELGAPNYIQAFKWIEASAKKGHGPAMAVLGQLYWEGKGVEKNLSQGKSWLEKAMKNQAPEAFLAVAKAYQLGQGGYDHSEQKAFENYVKAAQASIAEGQYQVGMYYSDGQVVGSADDKEALKWLEYAANQNHKEALYEVASRYEDGIGVKSDKEKAIKYYHLAANQGEPKSKVRMGKLLIAGTVIDKDEATGFKLIKEAVDSGYTAAEYDLALLYLNGTGTDKNTAEAMKLFELSALKGITEAQYQLGLAYGSGSGVPEDKIKSVAWLSMAAKSGNQKIVKARDLQMKKLNKEEMGLAKTLTDSMNSKMLIKK